LRLTAAYWRPAAAAESSDCGRGNAVGLTSILDLRQYLVLIIRLAHQSAAHVHGASSSFIFCGQMEDFFENTNRALCDRVTTIGNCKVATVMAATGCIAAAAKIDPS